MPSPDLLSLEHLQPLLEWKGAKSFIRRLSGMEYIVQASPSGHAAPLQVDISLPFKIHGRREKPAEQLPLQRLPDGSVEIRHERQRIDAGELPCILPIFESLGHAYARNMQRINIASVAEAGHHVAP